MVATYQSIANLINENDTQKAQSLLEASPSNDALWHYLYGALMLKKSWFEQAKEHLERATQLDPSLTSADTLLVKLMGRSRTYSDDYYNRRPYRRRSGCCCCCDDCCCELDCCDLICLDSCCECMGGDFIECI